MQGRLTCPQPTEEERSPEELVRYKLQNLSGQWIVDNEYNFVFGRLKLNYSSISMDEGISSPVCHVADDERRVYIEFKGEVYIEDTTTNETSLLYLEDGLHHREMPGLIVGNQYYWLPVFSRQGEMVAIDQNTFVSIPAKVHELSRIKDTILDDGRPKEYQAPTLAL